MSDYISSVKVVGAPPRLLRFIASIVIVDIIGTAATADSSAKTLVNV
jgi:hypothetical protein